MGVRERTKTHLGAASDHTQSEIPVRMLVALRALLAWPHGGFPFRQEGGAEVDVTTKSEQAQTMKKCNLYNR